MAELNRQWYCGSIPPASAACDLIDAFINHGIADKPYAHARTWLRGNLGLVVSGYGNGGTHRYFTSGVLSELFLKAHRMFPSDAEAWAVKDDQMYQQSLANCNDQPIKTEEKPMTIKTNPLFERRVFINGVDAATLTDDQIFEAIRNAEAQMKGLRDIDNQPKKLAKKIDDLLTQVGKVLAYVDQR
jgi:hypothetical protein